MKKILWLFILLIPFYVFAYSKYIIPGGDTLGIEVNSRGVIIVGYYKVDGKYINKQFKLGDRITHINDISINNIKELNDVIENIESFDNIEVTYVRNNNVYDDSMELVYQHDTYKTGLYVKSSVLGIGTLTYIDPYSNVYGVLGHSLNLSQTNKIFDVDYGYTYDASVTEFIKSSDGKPGTKNASIDKKSVFGDIDSNTKYGVFGIVDEKLKREEMLVGEIDDIKLGQAYIRTTNINNEIVDYDIEILEINKNNSDKNIYFKITDKELIEMSGGIVQGMSGSPILQNDMIVGAVTRVIVDDVSKGYGVSIVEMLLEGDKLLNE